MIRTAILTAFLLLGSTAMAEEVPRFNIEAMCRAAPQLSPNDKDTYQNCIRDETEARSQLERSWAGFDARQREMCVQETNVGGAPSYVDVLTCIQMASGSGQPRQRRKP